MVYNSWLRILILHLWKLLRKSVLMAYNRLIYCCRVWDMSYRCWKTNSLLSKWWCKGSSKREQMSFFVWRNSDGRRGLSLILRLNCYVYIMRWRASITFMVTFLSNWAFILAVSSNRFYFLNFFRVLRGIRSLSQIGSAFNMTSILRLELAVSFRTACLGKTIWDTVESSILIGTVRVIRPILLIFTKFCFKKRALFLYYLSISSRMFRQRRDFWFLDSVVKLVG